MRQTSIIMKDWEQALNRVEHLAKAGRWARLGAKPWGYLQAQWFNKWVYPKHKRGKAVQVQTFFGQPMQIVLPAGTDIYLTGGKTHDSEIRLSRLMGQRLKPGQEFVDIGAHLGFFSLWAAHLLGPEGRVWAFEASAATFDWLKINTASLPQIRCFHQALSDCTEVLSFYEFPVLYSEYNSLDVSQFEQEAWFAEFPPKKIEVQASTLDDLAAQHGFCPHFIKIDVEGAEAKVLAGMAKLLPRLPQGHLIVMEYLAAERHNQGHRQALTWMREQGYACFVADAQGQLQALEDMEAYLRHQNLDSENLVFAKPE